MNQIEVSIVMPCLDEAYTIGICVKKSFEFLKNYNISGEVIVVDNGSTDRSQDIAKNNGAIVIFESCRGYGNALMAGIKKARGKYVLIGDSDNTYDFSEAYPIILKLREDYQLVVGNRFLGKIEKGAMPVSHKYIGNPLLSFLGKILFTIKIGDFHCGLRGFVKEDINKLSLKTPGMEFASELIVEASLMNYKITEVPVNLYCDDENRISKLKTIKDGFRHLIYLLKAKIMNIDTRTIDELKKYILVGILNQLIVLSLLYLFTSVQNIWYIVSNVFVETITLFTSYLANNYWTFKNRKGEKKILRTLQLHLFNVLITTFFMYVLTTIVGIYYLISKILIVVISSMWSFVITKKIIYRKEME